MIVGEILCAFVILSVFHFSPHGHAHEDRTGLVVPLYTDPNSTWYELIKAKHDHPKVPIIAIINPSNGPGLIMNSSYVQGVRHLQSTGIVVLGYVHTSYGSRNSTDLESEIDSYKNWYSVNGILFDEMSNVKGNEPYYADLTKYVKTHGMVMTMGNPGIDTLPSYVGTVDNLVLYDNPNLPPVSLFQGWHENFTKNNFSFVSYGVESLDRENVTTLSQHVGYLYVTNQGPDNPWATLPGYFDNLIEMMGPSKIFAHHKSW